MGHMFGVRCGQCDYKFQANIGHGFLGCGFFEPDYDTGKPWYHSYITSKKIISDIEGILETWDDVREDEDAYEQRDEWHGHGSAQYLCPKCGRLHNKFFFALIGSGGKYQPTYSCSKCKSLLELVDLIRTEAGEIQIKSGLSLSWKCPNCGSDKLVVDNEADIICYD